MSSIPFLTTDGDAHARGLAHGRRFAQDIAANVATYLRRFAASGLDRDGAFSEAEIWCHAIAEQSPSYAEEMRGIADGSGQSEQAIALLNARYELAFTLFGQEATQQRARAGELLEIGPDGCTTFGLKPRGDRGSPHLARPELGLAGRRARTHLRPAGAANGASRVSSALPRPASPAEKWASTNAGSAWSRTGSPPATMAAILTASRSTCVAVKCWMRNGSNRRYGRSPTRRAPVRRIS